MMHYLNHEHPAFKATSSTYATAVQLLLSAALRHSRSFRLQFDHRRLQQVIGAAELVRIMPSLRRDAPLDDDAVDAYTIHEERLDVDKAEALQALLAFDLGRWQDLPLNYIKTVSLLDDQGQMLLHGSNMNDFMIFRLPEAEHTALIKAYTQAGIPLEAIEQVDVDPQRLYP